MSKRTKNKMRGWTPQQIAAATAAEKEAAVRSPQVVTDAFLPSVVTIADLKLLPVTLTVIMVLQKIDSPILKEGNNKLTVEDLLIVAYCLTTPCAELRDDLSQGLDHLRACAVELGDRLPGRVIKELATVIAAHIAKAMETFVPSGGGKDPLAKSQAPDSAGS